MGVMKKHGSNTENISQPVLRLGAKLWWLRAPLTFTVDMAYLMSNIHDFDDNQIS